MNFDNYCESIEYVPYLNYKVDRIHNLEIFNEVKYIADCAKKYKLDMILGGSCGTILHCQKFYRNIKDIDVHCQEQDAFTWLDFLENRYEVIYPPFVQPKDFLKNQLNSQHPIPFQNINNPKLKLDIIFKNINLFHEIGVDHKIFTKPFQEFDIKYIVLFKLFKFAKVYNRQTDKDDIEFYSKYVKYESLL